LLITASAFSPLPGFIGLINSFWLTKRQLIPKISYL